MGLHERFFRPKEAARTPSGHSVPFASVHASEGTQPGCGTVARKRARRYLAKRRLPKALWPLIVAMIFITILFDRQIEPALARAFSHNSRPGREARPADDGPDEEALPSETGAALNGEAALRLRPPADFQAKHAAQMIAFLIRNRGKLDNDVVREKWKHLDRTSMPLAVYLRDIEANDEWSILEQEIATCPVPPKSPTGRQDDPSSVRHRKILELMLEWLRRGEELLTSTDLDEPVPEETSEHRPDDDDTPPPPKRR